MSASFRREREMARNADPGPGQADTDHWHGHMCMTMVWPVNRINSPDESHFEVSHIRRRTLIVMSILNHLNILVRSVSNVILMVTALPGALLSDEKWDLNQGLVTRGDHIPLTRGSIIHGARGEWRRWRRNLEQSWWLQGRHHPCHPPLRGCQITIRYQDFLCWAQDTVKQKTVTKRLWLV